MAVRLIALTWLFASLHGGSARKLLTLGLLFDEDTEELKSALEAAISQYNESNLSHFRLNSLSLRVNTTDSFNFSGAVCSLLNKEDIRLIGMIGISSKATLSTVQAYSDNLQVPFILLNNPADPFDSQTRTKFQFFMQPTPSRAIVDVMRTYDWEDLHYFYDRDEGLSHVEQLFEYSQSLSKDLNIDAREVRDAKECFDALKKIHLTNGSKAIRVVLDLKATSAAEAILNVKEDQEILKIRFHFIVPHMSMNELNLTHYRIGGVNITGFNLVRPNADGTMKIDNIFAHDAIKVFTESLEELRKRIGSENMLSSLDAKRGYTQKQRYTCSSGHNWLQSYGKNLAQEMSRKMVNGDSGIVKFNSSGQRIGFELDVLEVTMYRGAANVGRWNTSGFYRQKPELILDKANRTIDNRTRIVVSISDPPYLMKKEGTEYGFPNIGNNRFAGFCVDLAQKVARNIGYEYHLRLSEYGGKDPDNQTWTGIIGELIRHEADIAIAPLTITSEREKVLDFTKPFMSLGISIMIKKPNDPEPHVFSFMEPLSQEIWLCTAFAFIGVSVVLFLVSRFSMAEWQVDGNESKLTNDFTIGNSLWFSLGAFMQQGCDVLPKSVSGRIVTSVWWFFTLIVISSYTANLAAYLTTMRMSAPISSAEDLAKQTEITYGTQKVGSTFSFFNGSTVSLYQRMMSFMTSQQNVFVNNNKEGIAKVREKKGKYAFLIESTTNEYHNNRYPCNTMKVGNNLDSKGYGIATPVGSEMRDMLTLAILELREAGVLEEMRKYWWYAKTQCPKAKKSSESKDNSLTLSKVAGIFYILVVGLGLSVISAIFEFLYKTKIDSKKQNVSFGSEARSKFRLSISGHSDDESVGVRTPLRTATTFTYTGGESRVGKTHTVV